MTKIHQIISPLALCLSVGLAGSVSARVRIKPHLYLGGGMGVTLGVKDQDFAVEDDADQSYVDFNDGGKQRSFLRGQIRLNLVEFDRFSIGYMFWSHYRKYGTTYSEYWVKKDKSYPFSDGLNLHAATVQWDLRYPAVSTKHLLPFVLVGAGTYYGASKSCRFEFIDEQYYYYYKRLVTGDRKYSGTVWMYGGGFVLLRYAYIYFGVTDFGKQAAPVQRALDCVFGIRL